MNDEITKKLQAEVDKLKLAQKEYHKAVSKKNQLDGQLNENKTVKEELDILKSGNNVFKLIGPVLIKQDLDEAKETVIKRIEYISDEINRLEKSIASLAAKVELHRENLDKMQHLFHQPQKKEKA